MAKFYAALVDVILREIGDHCGADGIVEISASQRADRKAQLGAIAFINIAAVQIRHAERHARAFGDIETVGDKLWCVIDRLHNDIRRFDSGAEGIARERVLSASAVCTRALVPGFEADRA